MTYKTLESFLRPRPSDQERVAIGKSLRQKIPRSTLAEASAPTRRQLPVELLKAQAATRIPELVPIRHQRMAANPFAFYRGAAALMAYDLSTLPSPPIQVQLCGDMHVSNFGFFSTAERQLVFGINDFDETLPGHFDWDLKRLTASAMIAAESIGQDQNFGADMIRLICMSYRSRVAQYAKTPYIELARSYIDQAKLLEAANARNPATLKFMRKLIAKARKNTNQGVIAKLTTDTPEGRRLTDYPPYVTHHNVTVHGTDIRVVLEAGLASYARSLPSDRRHTLMRYRLIDVARKVVGIGSVGTGCWVLYLEGHDESDPLFLQYKQAQTSVLAPYFSDRAFRSQGERVVHGQRLIHGAPDLFLGYGTTRESQFYVRQLRDMKGGIAFGEDGIGAAEFPDYARIFGWALANAHARSGDPALLSGYCGQGEQLDEALVKFSLTYARQNLADYETFLKAIKAGKLPCASDNI
jgi:uncharacterized protein (DUF2252 family)